MPRHDASMHTPRFDIFRYATLMPPRHRCLPIRYAAMISMPLPPRHADFADYAFLHA